MSSPISSLVLAAGVAAVLPLAACSSPDAIPIQDRIDCALGPDSDFAPVCGVERPVVAGKKQLVIRHADGGFRRFLIVDDGRGLVAADGAEPARVTPLADGRIEVAIGPDRYRVPATVQPGAAEPPR